MPASTTPRRVRKQPSCRCCSEANSIGTRLVFVGDPQRGIPPCAACHGPNGYKIGAPRLTGQHVAYIERQLTAFSQGIRENDINEPMRMISKQLTSGEIHALAAFYGGSPDTQSAKALRSR